MPLVSALIGTPDFSNLYVVLKGNVPAHAALADARKIPDTVIFAYGNFITVLINFLLLALIIFLMIKGMNRLKRRHAEVPPAPPGPSGTDQLLVEIRDELRKKA
jgi:large conductance mechanosensitive channel